MKIVDDGVLLGGCHAILKNSLTGVYAGATEMRQDAAAIRYGIFAEIGERCGRRRM